MSLSEQPARPPTLVARVAKALEDFTAQQKPTTQAAIAKALGVVNDWLARLLKN
jgi:hypothetical protein